MNTGYYKGGCSNPADKLMNGRQGWLAKWANHMGLGGHKLKSIGEWNM